MTEFVRPSNERYHVVHDRRVVDDLGRPVCDCVDKAAARMVASALQLQVALSTTLSEASARGLKSALQRYLDQDDSSELKSALRAMMACEQTRSNHQV